MTSLILQSAARALQPLLLFFSIFLLARGHDAPGGGFVGGLMASGAFALHAVAFGVSSARAALEVDPRSLTGIGLALALASALWGPSVGRPFFASVWTSFRIAGREISLGTPQLFDLGVYALVLGATLTIVFALGEE